MRTAGGRPSDASISGRGLSAAQYLFKHGGPGLAVAVASIGLLWLVWIYGNGLRHARYLDGWLLVGGAIAQLYFHIAIKTASLSPKAATRWKRAHIFIGYLLIGVFLSHSQYSLPDSLFEWALWTSFLLITLSGLLGIYLAWALQAKARIIDGISYDRIAARREELAKEVHAVVIKTDPAAPAIALPAPPYDTWIMELYTTHLREFFHRPHNFVAHLIGSQQPLKRLLDEIENLSRYLDQRSQEKLDEIKTLVIEKDRLDLARVYLGLAKVWPFVHVPATYALVVLVALHILVVYAFSSRAW